MTKVQSTVIYVQKCVYVDFPQHVTLSGGEGEQEVLQEGWPGGESPQDGH